MYDVINGVFYGNSGTGTFTKGANADSTLIVDSSTKVFQTQNHILTAIWIKNTAFDYNYIGDVQTFTAPFKGTYQIELWGAEGGTCDTNYLGGQGGYVKGNIELKKYSKLYVYTGQKGLRSSPGYNGGGTGRLGYSPHYGEGYGGGGATDIRLVSGTWDNFDSLKSRIMVAAGGGAGGYLNSDNSGSGGAAGGLIGYYATENVANPNYLGTRYSDTGGSQILGGRISTPDRTGQIPGGFGYGGYLQDTRDNNGSTGGGSGYYGGGPAVNSSGSSGGSSFISGYSGCNAISSSSTSSNIVHTNQPNHYSGYVFTNGIMIDGKGCNWSTGSATNCGSNQPQPNGTNTVGHSGNGHARITYLG